MRNSRLLLVLLPLVTGYLAARFAPHFGPGHAGVLPLFGWVFLALWTGFGLWLSRSKVNRILALLAGVGTPFLFLLLYLLTAGSRASIFPQLYFVAVAPAVVMSAAPVWRLAGDSLIRACTLSRPF